MIPMQDQEFGRYLQILRHDIERIGHDYADTVFRRMTHHLHLWEYDHPLEARVALHAKVAEEIRLGLLSGPTPTESPEDIAEIEAVTAHHAGSTREMIEHGRIGDWE